MRSPRRRGNHVVTCTTEHKCALEAVAFLGRSGCRVDFLPARRTGRVDIAMLAETITEDTALVSIMAANNEVGVSPLGKIAQ